MSFSAAISKKNSICAMFPNLVPKNPPSTPKLTIRPELRKVRMRGSDYFGQGVLGRGWSRKGSIMEIPDKMDD
eukprot:1320662-Amorphochlora_amoeboformis.AAC.1